MKKMSRYIPVMKTGDAELRGLDNLSSDVKNHIVPLIELTRSRSSKKVPQGDIFRRLQKLKEVFGNRPFMLDLTAIEDLRNDQIRRLQDTTEGYINWIEFLKEVKRDFGQLIPVIQISDIGVKDETELDTRIEEQASKLNEFFETVAYRFPISDKEYTQDIEVICKGISSKKIICIIDAGFILRGKSPDYSKKAIEVIEDIKKLGISKIALAATSFPKNIMDYSNEDDQGEFYLEEWLLYKDVSAKIDTELLYGDYATIHPIRSSQAGGNGWIPRIDVPKRKKLFFYRSRKGKLEKNYKAAYIRVAKQVTKDDRYKKLVKALGTCWGIEQIELAAEGYPQGLSPSFWISVRMNINITLRDRLLNR